MITKLSIIVIVASVALVNSYPLGDESDYLPDNYGREYQQPHPRMFIKRSIEKEPKYTPKTRILVTIIDDDIDYFPEEIEEYGDLDSQRVKRSIQPGGPALPQPSQDGWSLTPSVGRNDDGNTKAKLDIQHTGKDHDFNAGWEKVVRGPGKAKPTWHAEATFRW